MCFLQAAPLFWVMIQSFNSTTLICSFNWLPLPSLSLSLCPLLFEQWVCVQVVRPELYIFRSRRAELSVRTSGCGLRVYFVLERERREGGRGREREPFMSNAKACGWMLKMLRLRLSLRDIDSIQRREIHLLQLHQLLLRTHSSIRAWTLLVPSQPKMCEIVMRIHSLQVY